MTRATDGLTDAETRAASGKRILKASDDVSGTDRALSLRSAISTVGQLTDNNTVSKPVLQMAESALNDVTTAITSVQTLAMKANNGTLDADDKTSILSQLDQVTSKLEGLANTRYMDQYIFSGTATDQPTVTAQSGTPPYTYTGNDEVKTVQILSGVSIPTNIPGSSIFNFDGSAGSGSTDLFTMVADVKQAITSGDSDQLSAQLENIQSNLNNVLSCRSRLGSWTQRIEDAQSTLSDTKDTMQQLLSDTEDIDLPTAIIQLQTQQNAYQAALLVSSKVLNLSLASLQQS